MTDRFLLQSVEVGSRWASFSMISFERRIHSAASSRRPISRMGKAVVIYARERSCRSVAESGFRRRIRSAISTARRLVSTAAA